MEKQMCVAPGFRHKLCVRGTNVSLSGTVISKCGEKSDFED